MNGRGWRRWKSGGLYGSNGAKKHSRTYSEEYLVGCGRLPLLGDEPGAKGRRPRRVNGRRITRSNGSLYENNVVEEGCSIPWVDQRSLLPPSLGWYKPCDGTLLRDGLLNSFERSNKERKKEKSLEDIFNNHFVENNSISISNDLQEENGNLAHYEDVSFDIGSEEEFECAFREPRRAPSPESYDEVDSADEEEDVHVDHRLVSPPPPVTPPPPPAPPEPCPTKTSCRPSAAGISPWDLQTWTSRDLRRYLVLKASKRLGGPLMTMEKISNKASRCVSREPTINPQNTEKSPDKEGNTPPHLSPKEIIILRGGTFCSRENPTRGSLKIPRPPPPTVRQRHYSLPAIIVTHSEELSPPRDATPTATPSSSGSSSPSSSMNYLQVPHHCASSPRRAYSLKERPPSARYPPLSACRQTSSLDSTDDVSHTGEAFVPSFRRARRPSQLQSVLSLIVDSSEEDGEGEEGSKAGSPPPDRRPALADLLDYEEVLMYGRYSANLAEYARHEAKRLREEERQTEEMLFSKELQPYRGKIARSIFKFIRPIWDNTFARLGEDWVFLFFLGTTMATVSFLIDYIVFICFKARMYLHQDLLSTIHWSLQLFVWVTIPTLLVIFSAAFCQWLAPSAAGSGIPEMKTILRGVILKEYLTWKTLIAKIVGLATVIGAGLPLGKEGPVMHMASIVSTMLMDLLKGIKGVVDSEAHSVDLLAAATTMGVAVCYAAPIGGVLFSIEVTTVYFAVRNYWRGFFAAVVGAMFYRLMGVWIMNEETIYPIFKVEHNFRFPYDVVELLPFLCIGIFCGFAGSLYVFLHRRYVIFMRQNKTLKRIMNKRRLLYPTFVSIMISLSTYPDALGQFMASTVTGKQQILDLFCNVTWTVNPGEEVSFEQSKILEHWVIPSFPKFHLSLFIFQIVTVIEIAIASTLPVPNGILIPLLKVGAAFGRQIGEMMAYMYPLGLKAGFPIIPGAYAMVGAASFCAAITHTISISVIVFELTGQITYVIPIMIGVMISNCISSLLQPSIYDSVIRIKKLPYLPDIITATSDVYNIYVDEIMVRDVRYIWYGITYMDLKNVIKENRKLKYFPIVDKHDSMILLGSIPRIELVRLLVEQISSGKRRAEAKRRYLEALKKRWEEEDLQNFPADPNVLYEDEINTSEEEEEERSTKDMFKKLSRTLSRSLSRSSRSLSRSFSKNYSQPDSREGSPDRENDSDYDEDEDELKESESDSEPPTPTHSAAVSKLKDLFPLKSPFERKGSRFSVGKVSSGGAIKPSSEETEKDENVSEEENANVEKSTTEEEKTEPKDDDVEETADKRAESSSEPSQSGTTEPKTSEEPSPKKKSALDILRGAKHKMHRGPKDPLVKSKVRLTRSNSLDSLRPKSRNLKESAGEASGVKGTSKTFEDIKDGTPKKGILKRRNSVSLGTLNTIGLPPEVNYQTVSVVDTKLRNAIERIRKMKEAGSSMDFKLSQISLFKSKKKDHTKKKEFDMTEEEREVWELRELSMEVDFTKCHIDPAPFQLVERTSLLRVHSLFSMLGINHAYVTAIGRLIGVVALKEVRAAIEGQYVGKSSPTTQLPPNSDGSLSPPTEKIIGSATSPQMMGAVSAIPSADPEAGTVIRRSVSSNHLSAPVANGLGSL